MRDKSFDEFVTFLQKLSADYDFGKLTSPLIRKIIVVGVKSNRLSKCMSKEPNLTLEQAIRLGHSAEESEKHLSFQKQTPSANPVHVHNQTSHHPIQGETHPPIAVVTPPLSKNVNFVIPVVARVTVQHIK